MFIVVAALAVVVLVIAVHSICVSEAHSAPMSSSRGISCGRQRITSRVVASLYWNKSILDPR